MLRVGVIIPFFGGNKYLPTLLDSIHFNTKSYDLNVYIIDNSRSSDRVKSNLIERTGIKVIETDPAIGYGKACNIGYVHCKTDGCDILVVVNQDGYFAKGALMQLLSVMTEHAEVCAAMSFMADYDSQAIDPLFHHIYLSGIDALTNDLQTGNVKMFYEAELFCGAAFAINCKNYFYPYLFDELFYMYYEDVDLGRRMQYLGKKFVVVPSSIFHHKHTNTDPEKQRFRDLLSKKVSRNKYFLKDIRVGVFRKITSWGFLEVRNIVMQLIKLKLKEFFIYFLSFINALLSLPVIFKSRYKDRKIIADQNSNYENASSTLDL